MSGHPPVQIVDENDNSIGESYSEEAQDKGLIVRIARVMIEDESGRVLLQKRAVSLRLYPGCWDNSAAGHVDVGEDYLTAAKREMQEEIGVEGKELQEIGYYFTDRQWNGLQLKRFNRVYKVRATDEDIKTNPEEVSEVRWFSIKEAKKLASEHPDQVTDGLLDVLERCY